MAQTTNYNFRFTTTGGQITGSGVVTVVNATNVIQSISNFVVNGTTLVLNTNASVRPGGGYNPALVSTNIGSLFYGFDDYRDLQAATSSGATSGVNFYSGGGTDSLYYRGGNGLSTSIPTSFYAIDAATECFSTSACPVPAPAIGQGSLSWAGAGVAAMALYFIRRRRTDGLLKTRALA